MSQPWACRCGNSSDRTLAIARVLKSPLSTRNLDRNKMIKGWTIDSSESQVRKGRAPRRATWWNAEVSPCQRCSGEDRHYRLNICFTRPCSGSSLGLLRVPSAAPVAALGIATSRTGGIRRDAKQPPVLRKKTAQPLKSRMIAIISTKLGGINPSILVMQTTEYRFRKYRSSLGYGFHLAVCRRFLLNLIGNTWS